MTDVQIPVDLVNKYVADLRKECAGNTEEALEAARLRCLYGDITLWFFLAVEATLTESPQPT